MIPKTTTSYFVGEIFIPNIVGSDDYLVARAAEVTNLITVYEPEYLEMLLGTDLWDELNESVIAAAPADPAAKWVALLAQIFFTANSIPFSPAAHYIYYKLIQNQLTVTLNNGQVESKHENAEVVGAKLKLVTAWNQMVKMSDVIETWIVDNNSTYSTYAKPSPYYLERTNTFGI